MQKVHWIITIYLIKEKASLEEVYKHNKDNKALPELISKMHISNSLPDSANDNGNPLASK